MSQTEEENQCQSSLGVTSGVYGASSIRVLTDQEALERIPWLRAESLAAQYHSPVDFVRRLLKSAHQASWDIDLAISKYLDPKGDKSIVVPFEVMEAHKELSRDEGRGW